MHLNEWHSLFNFFLVSPLPIKPLVLRKALDVDAGNGVINWIWSSILRLLLDHWRMMHEHTAQSQTTLCSERVASIRPAYGCVCGTFT